MILFCVFFVCFPCFCCDVRDFHVSFFVFA